MVASSSGDGHELPALDRLAELGPPVDEEGPGASLRGEPGGDAARGTGADDDDVEAVHGRHAPTCRKCTAAAWNAVEDGPGVDAERHDGDGRRARSRPNRAAPIGASSRVLAGSSRRRGVEDRSSSGRGRSRTPRARC